MYLDRISKKVGEIVKFYNVINFNVKHISVMVKIMISKIIFLTTLLHLVPKKNFRKKHELDRQIFKIISNEKKSMKFHKIGFHNVFTEIY